MTILSAGAERLFRRTGDPILAWEVWSAARRAGVAAPEWVLEYLDGCAEAVNETFQECQDNPGATKNAAIRIAQRIGFGRARGGPTAFKARLTRDRREMYAIFVGLHMAETGCCVDEACREISLKWNTSESTLRRAYQDLLVNYQIDFGVPVKNSPSS